MRAQVAGGFAWIAVPGGPALVCRPLEPFAHHLFTTREWTLGSSRTEPVAAAAWSDVGAALGVPPERLVRLRQVHGASVVVRRAGQTLVDGSLPEADVVVADDPSIGLAVQAADCVPLLMADRRTGAVAAAHAGWRGLAAGVPGVAVAALAEHFGSRAADLVVAIGPSISAACYEVGSDVRRQFEAAPFGDRLEGWFPKVTRPGHWLFDGWRSARDQLAAAGVDATNIHGSDFCTFDNADQCCSYRRDGRGAGRMAAAIRMRN